MNCYFLNGGMIRNMTVMDKIAILILAHKNPSQLTRLIQAMDDERFDFFVHIDAKSRMSFTLPKSLISKVYVDDVLRIKTYFNDFSLVEATCSVMRSAFNKKKYKYFVLLTGQDYPIKSNDDIYNRLLSNYPTCWIDSYGVDEAAEKGVKWVEHVGYFRFSQRFRRILLQFFGTHFYFSSKGKIVKVFAVLYDRFMSRILANPRELVKRAGYTYCVGSHFWMLPDIAVKHILDKYDNDSIINDIFRHTAAAEESYFQTLLSTMPDAIIPEPYDQFKNQEKTMDNPALRLIKWFENGVHTNGHPAIWQIKDRDFMDRANALFARKFDSTIDSDILDYFDNIR